MPRLLELPIFPLKTVILPGGVLPLRIFEARYLDMVGDCMRNQTGFAVCLISEGEEVLAPASFYPVGTECAIVDWNTLSSGLLGITVEGKQKLRVVDHRIQSNGLTIGRAEVLAREREESLGEEFGPLCKLLERLIEELGPPYSELKPRFDQAGWVGARLAELLPLDLRTKQQLLETDDPLERIDRVWRIVTARPVSSRDA